MKIQICSRKEMEGLLKKGLPENTAVISFYDPEGSHRDYAPVDYSGQPVRLFQLPLPDIDLPYLAAHSMKYEEYFPQSDELAKFILRSVNDGCFLICQCDYGQSRSAACAAAILEHFEKRGISVFADDNYLPNQIVFNKLLNSLERMHTRPIMPEILRTMEQDRYHSYIEHAESLSHEGKTAEALSQLDMLMQIISSEKGADSMYAAYVCSHIASIYSCSEMYDKAAQSYEKSAALCILNKQSREAFWTQRSLAKMYCKIDAVQKAVSVCRTALEYQLVLGDREYIFSARLMLGDVLFAAKSFDEALQHWISADNSSESVLLRISKGYAAVGDRENELEYLRRAESCSDSGFKKQKEMLVRYKQEIDDIKAEIGVI